MKIEVPEDDNYSDDELTFFPYYTYFTNTQDPVKVTQVLIMEFGDNDYAYSLRT